MHLKRCLAFIQAKFNFHLFASHIKGVMNELANALSRNNLSYFISHHLQASKNPTPIPQDSDRLSPDSAARLDLSALYRSVERFFRNKIAPSTQLSYNSAKCRFLQFCTRAKVNPLPVSENLLCRYVMFLANDGLAPATIMVYLSAVQHLHLAMNYPDPNIGEMAKLKQVIKGAKREMKEVWSKEAERFDNVMIWAACCLCYFGLLRLGEVTVPSDTGCDKDVHLSMADISVDSIKNPSVVRARIKASKTDQFLKGVDIFVGQTENVLCQVRALMSYMARRGCAQGPFFRFEDHRLLTKDHFIAKVRDALSSAGIDAKPYSGHSFRIGTATMAGKKGLSSEKIQTLGGWESSAYLLYIRLSREELSSVSKLSHN